MRTLIQLNWQMDWGSLWTYNSSTNTGRIVGVGNLTGVLGVNNGFSLSGYSTGLEEAYTGLVSTEIFTGATQFATGAQAFNYNIASSGTATGFDTVVLIDISGGYNFSETGFVLYTGQAPEFRTVLTPIAASGRSTKGVATLASDNQTFSVTSNDRIDLILDSDQVRDDFKFESTFSGFASGALFEQVFAPKRQGADQAEPSEFVSTGFKKRINDLSGFSSNLDPIIVTGTGKYEVTGYFQTFNYVDNSFVTTNNFITGFTGIYTGSIPVDVSKTGIGEGFETGITGADIDQFAEIKFSGTFSGFSTGNYEGIQAQIPFDQASLNVAKQISGLKISGSSGPFVGSGDANFTNVTGINLIDMPYPTPNFPMKILLELSGLATGMLPEDPTLTAAVFDGTGVTGVELSEGTGVLSGSGIINESISQIMSGFTGINFNYNYIAEDAGNMFSGFTTASTNDVTGKNFVSDNVLMTGDYEYQFSAIRPGGIFKKQFTITGQDRLSGRIDFTGAFTYSGTGVYQHTQDITGVGYTGIGIFGAITAPTKDITFSGSPTGRKLANTGSLIGNEINLNGDSFGIPVSSVYDRYNPFHISGHSGIALICDHTNDTAPVFDFSTNDNSRSSYIHHPVWLRYNRLDSSDNKDIRAGLSPRYFLSGDGIHKSRNSNSVAISVYTGNDLNNLIWKETDAETSNNNTRFNEDFTSEDVREPDLFTEDFYFLINRSAQSLEPSGFYYFYFQDEENAQSAVSPSQFNTFFDSSSGSTRNYVTNYSTATSVSGDLLSADMVYPTGNTTNTFATSLPGTVSYNSGFNSFSTGFKMTGFAENVIVQGTGMTGDGQVTGSGKFSGFLHALQDRLRFPASFQTNEIFTQMTGNFNGDKSFNNFEINSGVFASQNIYLLSKKVDNALYQEVDEYESSNYKEVAKYRISTYQDSIEEISGDLKDRLERVGYSVYAGSGKLGFTSLPNMTYPIGAAFAFGTSSNAHLNSLSKDQKFATRQSGGLFTLFENGTEASTQGTNLPYSGIMSGELGFRVDSSEVTGTGFFESGVSGSLFITGFTGFGDFTSALKTGTSNVDGVRNIIIDDLFTTGAVPATGLGTGSKDLLVAAGERSSAFNDQLDMFPFSGISLSPTTQFDPSGGFLDEYATGHFIFSGMSTGQAFATGSGSTGIIRTTGFTGFENVDCTAEIFSLNFAGDVEFENRIVTGVFDVTGVGTGIDTLTISAGQTSGFLSSTTLEMSPFSGLAGSTDENFFEEFIGGFKDDYILSEYKFSGVPTGFSFVTGIATGDFDYTGIINITQQPVLTTGVRIGVGQMTGLATGMILPGSGSIIISGFQTGEIDFINSIINTGAIVIATSGNVAKSPFSGLLSGIFSGTGIYGENLNADVSSLSFNFPIPNYIKTFTGEYEIATGLTTGSLIDIPIGDVRAFTDTSLTGYSGRVMLTGDQNFKIRLNKKKYFDDSQDDTIITYSGEGTLESTTIKTGYLTIRG